MSQLDFGLPPGTIEAIRKILATEGTLRKAVIFGSRAKGNDRIDNPALREHIERVGKVFLRGEAMCDLTGFWRPVARAEKNDPAAWQARERVVTHSAIGRMVESYRPVWRRVQQGAPFMVSEQDMAG